MRLSIISFTENGKQLSERIAKLLERELEIGLYISHKTTLQESVMSGCPESAKCEAGINDDIPSDILFVKTSVGDWAKERMQEQDALLFIGACGIAVRAVAPFLTDKLHDVPVLVMDEKGKYVIPILSGHMGGANDLAKRIAEKTGAEPVITTATDLNKKFAVDLFAKKNNLYIANKDGIAKVSSKILAGKEITMSIESEHEILFEDTSMPCGSNYEILFEDTSMPCGSNDGIIGGESGIRFLPYPPVGFVDVVVTTKDDIFDTSLLLKPREYVIGIGCKKGKKANEIDDFIFKAINEIGISIMQIFALSSISQKRDEQGIIEWCRKKRIPFFTYAAEELQEVKGDFTKSSFVKAQVGVDNVCERAAVKACGEEGKLILPKTAENGMSIAVARKKWKVCFDGE